MTTNAEIFAVDFSALAREIAMDIFPLEKILLLHRLDDADWQRISDNPRFRVMLAQLIKEWEGAANTRERVRIKAASGLESVLEQYILEIQDVTIPLTQRVEAGKFLARLGELDGQLAGAAGERFSINLHMGGEPKSIEVQLPKTIEGELVP